VVDVLNSVSAADLIYPFFLAFAFFRFAAIAQGIMFRFLGGNASAPNAREVGMLTAPLAELGLRAVQ